MTQDAMEYRMNVHLFGAVSSPSFANYALRGLRKIVKHSLTLVFLNTILQNFYMDDCLTSLPTGRLKHFIWLRISLLLVPKEDFSCQVDEQQSL